MIDYRNTLSDQKEELIVVIFGPYKEGGHVRLESLRDSLRDAGYTNSNLVDELDDPPNSTNLDEDVFATTKSEWWVHRFDVALFVFYKNIPHGSVTVEVKELVDNVPQKIKCSTFFIEEQTELETLEKGTIKKYKREISYFDNDDDLFCLAEKACLNHIIDDNCINEPQDPSIH